MMNEQNFHLLKHRFQYYSRYPSRYSVSGLDEVAVASAILRIDEFVSLVARGLIAVVAAGVVACMHIGEASEESYLDYYYCYSDKEVVELDG
jgi:hypothetical protein